MYGELRAVMTFLCNLGYCLCTGSVLNGAAFSLFLFDIQVESSHNDPNWEKIIY